MRQFFARSLSSLLAASVAVTFALALAGGCRGKPRPQLSAASPDVGTSITVTADPYQPTDYGGVALALALPLPVPPSQLAASADGAARAAPKAIMPAPNAIAQHVIIISEDGLRPDAMLLAHGKMHAEIMRRGAYSMEARTIRHASTLPSHAAMLSGFDEGAHKLTWNGWKPERGNIQVPTIFEAALHAGRGSAAFVGKRKLEHIAPPGSIDVFSRPGFLCKKVVEEAARYFVEKQPQVEFVHFSDPDEMGHAIGWMSEPQIEAIRHTDACLTTMIEAVHAAGLDGTTLFILSADHGGHGRNHTGRTEEDRLIPWIAWGVGVRGGVRLTAPISTMDTAATVLWALGYPPTPDMQGRPVTEAFSNQAQNPLRVSNLKGSF